MNVLQFAVLIIIINSVNVAITENAPPTVTTPLGQIEGFTLESVKGRPIFSFEGIPYARPPVGKYRFQEPAPLEPWMGVWQAKTKYKCMQYDHFTPQGQDMVSGDEDCLYLNVYSPDLNPTEKLDVLIFIHGGAFMFNYGAMYGPEIILDRDIVFVSINYRLGPFGFLSTEDDVVPGNNGLKDQLAALKWVKENIEYFGGNPNSITIYGMSAGGASIHFQYLLPASKGLFHKGISQSGTSLNPWVIMEHPLEKAKKLSSLVGCSTCDTKQMVECLGSKPGKQITQMMKHFQPWMYNPFSPFGVVVDTWATNPLLPDHPYNLLKKKKVTDLPWLTSYVSSEGLYPAYDFYHTDRLEYLDRHWNEVMPHILHYNETVDPKEKDAISEKIRQHFLQGKSLTKETFSLLVQLISERLFVYDIEKAGRLHAAAVNSPVYVYYFNYRGVHSKSEIKAKTTENIGVSHADDTSYLLKASIMDTTTTEDDRLMCEIMVDMFTTFMKTGTPQTSPDWKPLSRKTCDPWVQLHIASPHNIFVEEKDKLGSRDFWDNIPFKENDRLFVAKDEL